jgi:phosphoglucosamine mutase
VAAGSVVCDGAAGAGDPPLGADAIAARAAYVEHLAGALDGRDLRGLHVVLDVANGAAHELAPQAFRALGAIVGVLHDAPDGTNINEACGSTAPASLQEAVRVRRAGLGIAFDGDADRCVAVDHEGVLVDGDQIMVALARDLAARGSLAGNGVVVTILSNLGLHRALRDAGIDVVTTPVGDRAVFAAMEECGYRLGGEQSGHVIVRDLATTGDGTLVGILFADLLVRTGWSAAALANQMVKLPQAVRNVTVGARRAATALGDDEPWRDSVRAVETELGERGRVVVRPSGTEPVVRVMVEAPSAAEADALADRIAGLIAG